MAEKKYTTNSGMLILINNARATATSLILPSLLHNQMSVQSTRNSAQKTSDIQIAHAGLPH